MSHGSYYCLTIHIVVVPAGCQFGSASSASVMAVLAAGVRSRATFGDRVRFEI